MNKQQMLEALPKSLGRHISDASVKKVNDMLNDPAMGDLFKDNMISFHEVLNEGRFTLDEYLNAIKYCSHKLAGLSNIDAYTKTFPERHKALTAAGKSSKDISSYVAAYNKTKLVTKILEQAYIPLWLVNQGIAQNAINHLAHLMMNAKSEKVQQDAAASLLSHLSPPKEAKVTLDVTQSASKHIEGLRKAVEDFSNLQRTQIEAGNLSVKEAAESKIIEGTYVDA